MMSLKKLPLESSESDSEELPSFTFLKQKLSLTESSQAVVVRSSDAECSSSSPGLEELPAVQEAARTVSPKEPITVLSSESEEEEELIPLVQRLQCRITNSFSKAQESSHQDSSSHTKYQHNEGKAGEWEEQPFPKALVLSNPSSINDTSKNDRDIIEDEPPGHVPAYPSVLPVQIRNLSATGESSVLSPPQKRSKYTQKEKRRNCRDALQTQRKQKETEQRQQERERKKALASMLKAQKPEECLKHITAVLDPALLQLDGGGQVLSALQAMECHCAIEAQTVPCSITWKRRASLTQIGEGNLTEEPIILVLLQEKEFMTMIYNSKQDKSEGKETLQSFVTWVTARTLGKTVSLAVVELEKCFSTPKRQRRQKQGVTVNKDQAKGKANHRGSKENREFTPMLSRVEIEMALVELQLHTEAQIRILKSWKELADFICMFTKAVAEAPFKHTNNVHLSKNVTICLQTSRCDEGKV
ncbi:crossover junction endonuclease EME1 isoform X2 [Macrotis lagotis]|uniref:crossover junction endonuclease EME1 isoform X2 n=1 Tax=Macrotis lagotis TaxID=92651 RepID=UPI003D68B69F